MRNKISGVIASVLSFFLFVHCSNDKKIEANTEFLTEYTVESDSLPMDTLKEESFKGIDLSIENPNLIDIMDVDSTFKVELRYATTNNFMGIVLYDSIRQVFLQKDVADKLKKAQEILRKTHPAYSLLVYDGGRPISVQQKMWDALDSIPPKERGKFLSNPKNGGSVHNYGAAVDLTICDENGIPLDMGADYDEIDKIAYPSMEQQFLAEGKLTKTHISNRQLLRKIMREAGFFMIQTEWWHFNSCTRSEAMRRYQLIE